MYHLVGNFQNKSGDALAGYFVKLKDSDGAYASLYSDINGTPISTVSGVTNSAITDSTGTYDLWVADGEYDVEFYDKNDATLLISRTVSTPFASGFFKQNGSGAVRRPSPEKEAEIVSAKDFGAAGDGTTDDTAAIQAALDYVGGTNGGTVILPKTTGYYRVTDTIRIPSYVTLCGAAQCRYPYVSGAGHSGIVADFADPLKWVIEADTTDAGVPFAYNVMVSGTLPSAPAYNCGIRDLIIRSVNTTPYGGIRIHGAPGAVVENVGIAGVGCGLLLNYSFDCKIRVHSMGLYYGFAAWDDVNACSLDIYAAQDASVPATVPAGYRLPFMTALAGTLVGAYAMAVEHDTRPFGAIIGSSASLSVNNDLRLVSERYKGGMFLFNANGLHASRVYLEGTAMEYGIVAANSTFSVQALHAFMDSVGALFDLGAGLNGSVAPGGLVTPASFGTGPYQTDGSRLVVYGAAATGNNLAPTTPRVPTVKHPDVPSAWVDFPAAGGGWTNNATYKPGYRINAERLELRGFATGGSTSVTAWTLPAGFRPTILHNVAGGFGGQVSIDSTGAIQLGSGTVLGLDGVSVPLS